jgi:hypothetical protein
LSSTVRRGQYITDVPSTASGRPRNETGPACIVTVSIGGQPVAASASSSPQRASAAVVRGHRKCVDIVSLGKRARSSTSTRRRTAPRR